MRLKRTIQIIALYFIAVHTPHLVSALTLQAKDTLTALEMDHGDTLLFRLRSGRAFRLDLEGTDAALIETVKPGGIIYTFRAHVRVDGHPMTLTRYVCSQECFYEPYVINGVRIWLDTVKDVFDLIPVRYPREGHLQCRPRKQARLTLQDMTLRICPEQTSVWIDDDREGLKVGECYNGDDCYLGPYLGEACHVGMDVNHKKGSILSAPITFDTHAYFNSLEAGHNNNRWRGIRRWPNGDVWALQSHHLIKLLVSPHTSLSRGKPYATTAGVHVGSHEHTHFEFKIGRAQATDVENTAGDKRSIAVPIDFDDQTVTDQEPPAVLHLDPWIVFWQIFEDGRIRNRKTIATMKPVEPGRTGQSIAFSAEGSLPGDGRDTLKVYWTFGDGGWAQGKDVTHIFSRAGVYPVSVAVDDGNALARFTQHISISGKGLQHPVLALTSAEEPSFRPRPIEMVDTYGETPRGIPHTVLFTCRASHPKPRSKTVTLVNKGGGTLPGAAMQIKYAQGRRWLSVISQGEGNQQQLDLSVDTTDLHAGLYTAMVLVECPDVVNSPQEFRVQLQVRETAPPPNVIVDDRDPGFYTTPYFWVGHRFCRCPEERRGYKGFYLTNGGRPRQGEFVRFTPDLQAGLYSVSLAEETPFLPDVSFKVKVRHQQGEETLRIKPTRSRAIDRFHFGPGTDGYVEIHADDSEGLVIADAIHFNRIEQ